jgi:hypothetical protein
MKQFVLPCMAIVLLLSACNNNKKTGEVTVTSENGKEKVTVDVNQMQKASEEMEKQKDELQKLTPLSLDELKVLMPEQIMGSKRSNYNATTMTGAGYASAEYVLNDSTNIRVGIYDCGGPGGAGIYGLQYLSMYNVQSESDNEYTKTIDFKGSKAFEHCDKMSNRCTLTYFTGGRFLVILDGQNVNPDGLKQAAGELNIKS